MNTQAVVDQTQSLGWIINQEKSELKPTQVFSFVGYEYHLDSALVKPTQERWLKLQDLILRLKSKHVLTARCLMLLIGLLASTEKMVPEGRLHMRPFQFHLKENWRYPHCLCLPSNGSPSQGDPKDQTMLLLDHHNSPRLARDALVLGPSAAINRDATATSSVNNSSQTVLQLRIPQQSTASQPPRLVSRSGQLQEQGFSVEVAERIAAPQRSSTRTIYKSNWALFEKWAHTHTGLSLTTANPWPVYSRGSYIPWVTPAYSDAKPKWPFFNHN